MAILVFTVAFGILFAYFATQNTGFISLRFGQYLLTGIPIYLVVLASMLIGLLVAGVFSFFGWVSSGLRIAGKDYRIRSDIKIIESLRDSNAKLKEENDILRGQVSSEKRERIQDKIQETRSDTRSFFERLRHGFSI